MSGAGGRPWSGLDSSSTTAASTPPSSIWWMSRRHWTRSMAARLKVLMSADAVGGVWSYSLELARALAPHGVEVVLATMGPLPSDSQREDVARLRNVRLVTSECRL